MATPTDGGPIAPADPAAEYRELAPEIDAAVSRVLASGRYILGPEGAAFETQLASYVGAPHAVGVSSGTEALHLALRAAGIGAGDEVIVPAFTFIATAEAVSYTGARPIFADVDEDTFCIDPRSIESKLTSRTRAVIAVHLFGQTAPLEAIAAMCRGRKLVLIEDCAQALGADEGGRRAGSWGDFGCFSFYPTKNLAAAGDAGLVTAQDENMAGRLRMLRHHGQRQPYVHEFVGFNGRLDELQAAILRVKLAHIDRLNGERARIAGRYREGLAGSGVTPPHEHRRGRHVYHQFTIKTERRDEVQAALARNDVAAMVHYRIPLHLQPAYARDCKDVSLPVAEDLARRVLALPIHPYLSDESVRRVCEVVRAATNVAAHTTG